MTGDRAALKGCSTGGGAGLRRRPFDPAAVRRDFPILQQQVHGKPLVYLDNAATTQKPLAVVQAISDYYLRDNANIHRGVHLLSERATAAYEDARRAVQAFINAREAREVIFVRGTTEGINLVAQSLVRQGLAPGDEIVVSVLEHHSNFVPWVRAAAVAADAARRARPRLQRPRHREPGRGDRPAGARARDPTSCTAPPASASSTARRRGWTRFRRGRAAAT
ncbi:MAG: cysteine sulfinate desulfinase [Acidobacteria bacterium]|nr:cysteine sulfinate desulfinase [Acidobacteriota bacterium]